MNIFMRVWLAINQGVCLIVTGQNDMTISGWSYYRHIEHGKSNMYHFVNYLFFWQEDHCKSALIWEYRKARELQAKLYPLYINLT